MSITVIEPGKLVRVEPEKLDANDILEFGAALIEKHGHRKQTGGSTKEGFSIHGAIGEAAARATGSSGKDSGTARPLREAAAKRLEEHHSGQSEFALNDTATSGREAADRMRAAIDRPFTTREVH